MRDETLVVRAGHPPAAQGDAFLPGPVFAGPYHAAGEPAESPYTYGRFHNPTWTGYEAALAALEGGATLVFASGMAATTAILGTVLRPGDVVLLPSESYYTTRVLSRGYFAEMGVVVRLVPTSGAIDPVAVDGARLVWLESPTNPGLDVCDIAAWVGAAHAAGALVAVDNTTATPLGQRPLALGADFVVASDTKSITGHGDLILGHVAARDTMWVERLRTWRTQTGSVAGPFEVWLAHRSLATLALRLERQCENAQAIAGFLAARREVVRVRYPGLRTDPGHDLARRQMQRFGPVVSFELAGRTEAERFLGACHLVDEATSFGGMHTTAERRARWGGDSIGEGFIRLSAGCEHIDDLLADLGQALGG
ncbi:MAG: cystathionine gamma-lyase [Gemmatimonadales bacterium]